MGPITVGDTLFPDVVFGAAPEGLFPPKYPRNYDFLHRIEENCSPVFLACL